MGWRGEYQAVYETFSGKYQLPNSARFPSTFLPYVTNNWVVLVITSMNTDSGKHNYT